MDPYNIPSGMWLDVGLRMDAKKTRASKRLDIVLNIC